MFWHYYVGKGSLAAGRRSYITLFCELVLITKLSLLLIF